MLCSARKTVFEIWEVFRDILWVQLWQEDYRLSFLAGFGPIKKNVLKNQDN